MNDKITKKVKKETDTEMLARLMLSGFEEIKRTMATKEELAAVKRGQEEMKEEISSLKEEQKETNRTVKSYEKKQAGMLLSLDETVHRSEFDGLVRRVEVLEK
jgi:multidrug resistance efflux pump